MSRIDELRAERRRLIGSMEFAYAMGHRATLGDDPRLEWVVQRVDELAHEIAALEAAQDAGGGGDPPPPHPSGGSAV